jgi:hypothetical protein
MELREFGPRYGDHLGSRIQLHCAGPRGIEVERKVFTLQFLLDMRVSEWKLLNTVCLILAYVIPGFAVSNRLPRLTSILSAVDLILRRVVATFTTSRRPRPGRLVEGYA